jgi:hypothetical protein
VSLLALDIRFVRVVCALDLHLRGVLADFFLFISAAQKLIRKMIEDYVLRRLRKGKATAKAGRSELVETKRKRALPCERGPEGKRETAASKTPVCSASLLDLLVGESVECVAVTLQFGLILLVRVELPNSSSARKKRETQQHVSFFWLWVMPPCRSRPPLLLASVFLLFPICSFIALVALRRSAQSPMLLSD